MHFIRSGFRIVRENPSLIFAEIAWRWAFGAAAWIAIVVAIRAILEGISVSEAEMSLARTDDAYRIADAVVRVIVQVLPRLIEALVIVIPLLAIVWIIAATAGRAITIRALLSVCGSGIQGGSGHVLSLFILNVIRAVFTIATFLAFFGTVFLVSSQFTPNLAPSVGPALIFGWLCLALVVALLWAFVNWFLALAPIFILRDGHGVRRAIGDSLGLYRYARTDYAAIATMFGVIRGAALVVAIIAGFATLAAGSVRGALVASAVVALVYFAVADFLYVARLAAYVELACAPVPAIEPPTPAEPLPSPSPAPPNLGLET